MRKVLVFRSELLRYSETFIKEQVLSFRRWEPVLTGLDRVPGLELDGMDIRVLNDKKTGFWQRVYRRVLRAAQVPDPLVIATLKREKASLIHVHFGTEAVGFWPVAKALGLPVIVTLHGFDINVFPAWWKSGEGGRANKNYPDRLLELTRQPKVLFIAVSEAIRQRAIEYGVPPNRIVVNYIGVDPTTFYPSGKPIKERSRRILFVGRMVEKKGGAFLIEAFARVRREIADAELVMIGDGPLLQYYRDLSHRLGVPVRFLGACPPFEVKKNMDAARVFCLPSVRAANGDAEGLGIVILEAQAAGVPVITSAFGGAIEGILEGKTGFAFEERNVDALADKLRKLLLDDDLAASMSEAAPQFIREKFDIGACTSKLEDFYDDVVRKLEHHESNY